MLLPRVLTAIVGIPLLLWLTHAGGLAFSILVAGIGLLCCYEYALILRLGGRPVQFLPTLLIGGALSACAALGGPLGLTLSCGAALVALVEVFSKVHSLERASLTLFGAVFAGWMPSHLALIRDLRPYGENYVFLLFVAVWVCDSAAYFTGRSLGRTPLAPVLSPKKTWEGAVAGLAGAVLVCLAIQRWVMPDALTPLRAILVGAIAGTLGQVSDVAESMVKRDAGVKDSGALLPGHGGIFDRFDSFILAAPAAYYALSLSR